MNWYYAVSGETKGPASEEEFQSLIAQGVITPTTLVWKEGMAAWQPLSQIGQPPAANLPPVLAPASGQAPGGGAVCSQCGRTFPPDEVVRIGLMDVCAECKPAYVQRVKEGGDLTTGRLPYAGFWIRFAAKLIDGVIMTAVNMASQAVIVMVAGGRATPQPGVFPPIFFLSIGISFAMQLAYGVFFVGKFGATPGKMACGLRIVSPEGGRISYLRALGRMFAEQVSGLACCIGYLMVAWDSERRGLHDMICSTRVIYNRKAS